eukprot:scaffold343_cov245-Pinguiococcus_pyrenoidosus.AAC.21
MEPGRRFSAFPPSLLPRRSAQHHPPGKTLAAVSPAVRAGPANCALFERSFLAIGRASCG